MKKKVSFPEAIIILLLLLLILGISVIARSSRSIYSMSIIILA